MKKIIIGIFLFLLITIPNIMASEEIQSRGNENIGFKFEIGPNNANSYSAREYRATDDWNNAWKVNMTDSWECESRNDTCLTRYWITNDANEHSSDVHDISEQEGNRYFSARSNAKNTMIRLTAENNNKNNETYDVKGYWDEETGVYV